MRSRPRDSIDRLRLQVCITLLDHPLLRSEYESVVLSGLAVMGMRADDGWLVAEDYTPKFTGFIKGARTLVVYDAQIQGEEELEVLQRGMSETQARIRTEGVFLRVQRKVQRYMTLVQPRGSPDPMNWIYERRSYGFKIRYKLVHS